MDERGNIYSDLEDRIPELDKERLKEAFAVAQKAFAESDNEELVSLLTRNVPARARIAAERARHFCS